MEKIMSYQLYYDEVRACAENILNEYEIHEDDTKEDIREYCLDRAHEYVDEHQWIVYRCYNPQILDYSDNNNAYFEDFGPLTADSAQEAITQMAFAAFHRDILECLEELIEKPVSKIGEESH